jgi:hypothetical protein
MQSLALSPMRKRKRLASRAFWTMIALFDLVALYFVIIAINNPVKLLEWTDWLVK